MNTTTKPAVATAVVATICGALLGWIVATATGHDLHLYLKFVVVLVLVALAIAGTWVYRAYVHPPAAPAVEEADVEATP